MSRLAPQELKEDHKFVLWESLSCIWCITPMKPRTVCSTLLQRIKYGFRTRHITWKHSPSPPAKEVKAAPSVWKITATLVNSLDRGDILTAERSCGRCNWQITEGHSSHKNATPKLHLAWQRQVSYCQLDEWLVTALRLDRLRTSIPTIPTSRPVSLVSLATLRIIWLASDLQKTWTWSKLSPLGNRHLTLIEYKPCCHVRTNG